MNTDIRIEGQGFYAIQAVSSAARRWMRERVHFTDYTGVAYAEDAGYARAIACGAVKQGFTVTLNGNQFTL